MINRTTENPAISLQSNPGEEKTISPRTSRLAKVVLVDANTPKAVIFQNNPRQAAMLASSIFALAGSPEQPELMTDVTEERPFAVTTASQGENSTLENIQEESEKPRNSSPQLELLSALAVEKQKVAVEVPKIEMTPAIAARLKTVDITKGYYLKTARQLVSPRYGYQVEQAKKIIMKRCAYNSVETLLKLHGDLILNFNPEQIIRIAFPNGGSRALKAVKSDYPNLKALQFSEEEITQMAGHDGGTKTLENAQKYHKPLVDFGFTNEYIAAIGACDGSSKTLKYIAGRLGIYKSLAIAPENIVSIATIYRSYKSFTKEMEKKELQVMANNRVTDIFPASKMRRRSPVTTEANSTTSIMSLLLEQAVCNEIEMESSAAVDCESSQQDSEAIDYNHSQQRKLVEGEDDTTDTDESDILEADKNNATKKRKHYPHNRINALTSQHKKQKTRGAPEESFLTTCSSSLYAQKKNGPTIPSQEPSVQTTQSTEADRLSVLFEAIIKKG